jgi:uncharacterized protein (DUF433 family)
VDWQERIITDPDILVGKPVVRGTQPAVDLIIDLMAQEWPDPDILRNYPGLTHEGIQACLSFENRVHEEHGGHEGFPC